MVGTFTSVEKQKEAGVGESTDRNAKKKIGNLSTNKDFLEMPAHRKFQFSVIYVTDEMSENSTLWSYKIYMYFILL